ncbi:MAG: hypothetical protein JRK53_17420 [Deltaproteobacteria bacterium]|nr:hypothetical protein [Deltaproteobacteria bacterium]
MGRAEVEEAVYLQDILKILGWSRSKFFEKRRELVAAGVIHYRRERGGSNPRKPRIIAFPSRVQRWIALKSARGETI